MEQIGNIHIIEAEDNFKRVHKSIIENENIDCETLGVYTRIIVLGLKWNLNIKGLSTHLGLSDAKIRKAISALEKEGYIVRTSVKGDGGKFLGWDYKVLPTPIDEAQRSSAGKRTSQKTDTPSNGQHRSRTTPFTDNTENGEENNNKLKGIIDLKKEETKKKNFNFKQALIDLGVSEQIAADYMAVRKLKRAANTETAFNRIKSEIEKSGASADDCIRLAVERSWQGFKAEWYNNSKISNQQANLSFNFANKSKPKIEVLNEDGDLPDGTFYKGGKRWYISEKDGRPYSIPLKAPNRPDKRSEWSVTKQTWYVPLESWEASDELW